MKCLSEALISSVYLTKTDVEIFIKEFLDKFEDLDYEIVKRGNKHWVVFRSFQIGDAKLSGENKKYIFDGKALNCNIQIELPKNEKTSHIYIKIRLYGKSSDEDKHLFMQNNLKNIKIYNCSSVDLERLSRVENVNISKIQKFNFVGFFNKNYTINNLNIQAGSVCLYDWLANRVSHVKISCDEFEVIDSEKLWEEWVQKMNALKKQEDFNIKEYILNQSLLQKSIEDCLNIKFDKFPNKLIIENLNENYVILKQNGRNYTCQYNDEVE